MNIVAHVARRLGVPCRVHVPSGDLTPELREAQAAGAEVVQHRPGHNSVIIARARADAKERGWVEIPFGMECAGAVEATRAQVANLPDGCKRLVVPVGSGMTLAGVLWGLLDETIDVPVIGVVVGADPRKRLGKYAPPGWEDRVTLVPAGVPYDARVPAAVAGPHGQVHLDSVYEAKCLRFLQPDDCLWCVGVRSSELPATAGGAGPAPVWRVGDARDVGELCAGQAADLVFTCPPYADLEVYSDDPRDLSTLGYAEFRRALADVLRAAAVLLKPDRFVVLVVGEVRGKDGNYYGLVPDTVAAAREAGLVYYDELILVTAVGSLPIRAGGQFASTRKIGKTHQNVLVFAKGDPVAAAKACGPVEVGEVPAPQGGQLFSEFEEALAH